MPSYRISEIASLFSVSDDTVRRWVDAGKLATGHDDGGRLVVAGEQVAELARSSGVPGEMPPAAHESARNRLRGIVTDVQRDGVMAKVEMRVGPNRIVSLMTREAADELQLAPGVIAVASVKATQVVIETPS